VLGRIMVGVCLWWVLTALAVVLVTVVGGLDFSDIAGWRAAPVAGVPGAVAVAWLWWSLR